MRAYWWRTEPDWPEYEDAAFHLRGPRVRNFGDELTGFILRKMGLVHEWSSPSDAELILTGSILEHLPDRHWAGTICGAGKLYERSRINLADARVYALRGKLTLAGCRGVRGNPVLGDPGLLAPRWVRQPFAKYDLGVLPHWKDHNLWRRFSYGSYIDPQQSPDKVLGQIASCKRLITSSLHGMIVADAYGIPRQVERDRYAHGPDGDFKFRDYTSIYDEEPHFGEMWQAPADRVEQIQNDLYKALQIATGIDLGEDDRLHPQISLLVPFRDDGEHRARVWKWLRRYWRERFPTTEMVQGWDDGSPFSKATAVNNAASIARGRTFVILDADAYMYPSVLQDCANQIDEAIHSGGRSWWMPYTSLYRLNQQATLDLLHTHPERQVSLPPPSEWLELTVPTGPTGPGQMVMPGAGNSNGHQYGALAQVMPREAFELVGGMDARFRGWGCCDESTEIFTSNGWRSYTDVNVGDQVLTLNHDTGMSEWKPIQKMNIHPGTQEMLSIESKTHSSLTTLNHRWPVIREWSVKQVGRKHFTRTRRDWATSEKFQHADYVPIAAGCADLPADPKYTDAFVEVVAWFWTEGHIDGRTVTISQSHQVNADKCELITSALTRLLGPESKFPRRGKSPIPHIPRWHSFVEECNISFQLNAEAGEMIQVVAPGRVPTQGFLLSLTKAQLDLFIATSMLGDGHTRTRSYERVLSQKDPAAIDAFQFALILAGHATSNSSYKIDPKYGYDMSTVSIRQQRRFKLAKGTHKRVTHEGVVWCPTTENGSWLARRNGKVYFTGNSEDSAFLKSLDTLYCQHAVAQADVMHLWHAKIGAEWFDRQWVGQSWATANSRLAQRYSLANTEIAAMRGLCDEHPLPSFDWA